MSRAKKAILQEIVLVAVRYLYGEKHDVLVNGTEGVPISNGDADGTIGATKLTNSPS
jgi:hypothetical protein